MRSALWILVATAACGGPRPEARAPAPASASGATRSTVALYRDGALVRHTVRTRLPEGPGAVPMPAWRWQGPATLEVLDGPGTVRPRSLMTALDGDRGAPWRGARVRAGSGEAAVEGELVGVGSSGVAVRDRAGAMHLLPAGVFEVRAAGASTRRWRVVAERAGDYLLEIGTVTRALRWSAAYALVLDPGRGRADRQGRVAIDNDSDRELAAASVVLIDAGLERSPADTLRGAGSDAAGRGERRFPPAGEAPASVSLDGAVRIPAGVEHQREIVGRAGRGIPARVRLRFDPVGDGLDEPTRRPVARRDYGTGARGRVSFAVELDTAAAGLERPLPPGPVRVYQRDAHGLLRPVGMARLGTTSEPGDPDLESGSLELVMGQSPLVTARRRQADFHVDERTRRLVEEIRVAIDNRGDTPVEVEVIEHLYRGMNWTMAYYNRVGPVTKTGPQEVRFTVPVAGDRTAELVYRVVYTW